MHYFMERTALKSGHSQNIIGGRIQETMVSKSGLEMSSKDGIVNCMSPKKNGCFTIAIEGKMSPTTFRRGVHYPFFR